MTMFRAVRSSGYTHLPNGPLGMTLSLKALGLLWYMLSKPDSWRFESSRIANDVRDGRDSVRSGLRELEDAGFVLRVTIGGANPKTEVWVRDSLTVAWPSDGFSGVGSADVGKSVALVTTEKVTTEKDMSEPVGSDVFDRFWSAYPRKQSKKKALQEFERAVKRDGLDTIRSGFVKWRDYWVSNKIGMQFIPLAQTWLSQQRYFDDPIVSYETPKGDVASAGGQSFKIWDELS